MLNGEIVQVCRNVRKYGEVCFSGDIVTLPSITDRNGQTGMTSASRVAETNSTTASEPVDMLCINVTRPNLYNVFVYYGNRTYLGVLDKATRTVYFRTEEDTWLGTVKSGYAVTVGHNSHSIPVDTTVSHRGVMIQTIADILDEALRTGASRPESARLARGGMMWDKSDRRCTLDLLTIAEYFGNNPTVR